MKTSKFAFEIIWPLRAYFPNIYTVSIGARPRNNQKTLKPNIANTSSNYQKLEKHTQEFNEPKIISVCDDKIHVAIGYGLANAILIEGDTGILHFGKINKIIQYSFVCALIG